LVDEQVCGLSYGVKKKDIKESSIFEYTMI